MPSEAYIWVSTGRDALCGVGVNSPDRRLVYLATVSPRVSALNRYVPQFAAALVLACIAFTSTAARADYQEDSYPRRLSGNEPSYFVWAYDDENHVEFYLSVKYPLTDPFSFLGADQSVFFVYNGKYDFFFGTRESSPVVSRQQNPGVMLKGELSEAGPLGLRSTSIGWFHESNGQHIETAEEFDTTENAEDFVSRGWDYLAIEFKNVAPLDRGTLNFYTRLRAFCDCQGLGFGDEREDDIFWEPVDSQPDVNDFNGLRLIGSYISERRNRYSLVLRTGTRDSEAFQNLSLQVEATIQIAEIPFHVFYFDGYGKDLSTYHLRDQYLGIGLELW